MTTFTGKVPREVARKYGEEALAICETGEYVTPSGLRISIREMMEDARGRTVSYPPKHPVPQSGSHKHKTVVEVVNETTLSAAWRLLADSYDPVILNFASATTPGGGFLQGARAQEEYLAWSSCLYACLRDNGMYAFHRENWTPFYTDYALYSPKVPVFREESGDLLEPPYRVSIITCAAVNANKVPAEERPLITPQMARRIYKVLAIGQAHGHDAIVLGAWGCGAFGNDPVVIADLFRQSLAGPFSGKYQRVIFAIVDWSSERKTLGPFEQALLRI